jgi:hypothetical protein
MIPPEAGFREYIAIRYIVGEEKEGRQVGCWVMEGGGGEKRGGDLTQRAQRYERRGR